MSDDWSDQEAFVRSNFGAIWPEHLSGFVRLLVQLREKFDGDLDLAIVLAVIASRTPPEEWMPELPDLGEMTVGTVDESRQLPINILSVAAYAGIPRETVRRKVTILQRLGWVTRAPSGQLSVTRQAATDLKAATGATVTYLAGMLSAFDAARQSNANRKRL